MTDMLLNEIDEVQNFLFFMLLQARINATAEGMEAQVVIVVSHGITSRCMRQGEDSITLLVG